MARRGKTHAILITLSLTLLEGSSGIQLSSVQELETLADATGAGGPEISDRAGRDEMMLFDIEGDAMSVRLKSSTSKAYLSVCARLYNGSLAGKARCDVSDEFH